MKTVQDKDGNIIEVADNTPCHAGKNGALPVMLDDVIDADIFAAIAAREAAWLANANVRAKSKIKEERVPLLREADLQINKHIDIDHVNLGLWKIYRQALRDFPAVVDLDNIVWPVKPITLP